MQRVPLLPVPQYYFGIECNIRCSTWVDDHTLILQMFYKYKNFWAVFVLPPSGTPWSPSINYCDRFAVYSLRPWIVDDALMNEVEPILLDHVTKMQCQNDPCEWVAYQRFPPWKYLLTSSQGAYYKERMKDYMDGILRVVPKRSFRSLHDALKPDWVCEAQVTQRPRSVDETNETTPLILYHGRQKAQNQDLTQAPYGIFFSSDINKAQSYGGRGNVILATECPTDLTLPVLDGLATELCDLWDFRVFGWRFLPKLMAALNLAPKFVIGCQRTDMEVVLPGTSLKKVWLVSRNSVEGEGGGGGEGEGGKRTKLF